VADIDRQVAHIVFDRPLPPEDPEGSFTALDGAVVDVERPGDSEPYREALDGVAGHVAHWETRFAESVWAQVVRSALPGATRWDDLPRDRVKREEALADLADPRRRADQRGDRHQRRPGRGSG
jgi:hypothetical protein